MTNANVPRVPDIKGPTLGPLSDLLAFKRGWHAYFCERQQAASSDIFRTHLGIKAITILDAQAMSVLFDTNQVTKSFGIGPFVPPRALLGNHTPTIFLNGEQHDRQKAFWLEFIKTRSSALYPTFETCFARACDTWKTRGAFSWDEQLDQLFCDILFAWLLQTTGSCADLEAWLSQIFTKIRFGSRYRKAIEAYGRLRERVRGAPLFEQAKDLGASFGMTDDEVCAGLLFGIGFNAWAGLAGLARSLIAELSVQHSAREALMSTAPAGLGDAKALLNHTPSLHFVLEVLRLHPPVNLIYAKAQQHLILASKGKSFAVAPGEMLMGMLWFAHRDPAVFEKPDAFLPDRFSNPAARHPVMWANGHDDDLPKRENKMCAGRDIVLLLMQMMACALSRYDFVLQQRPQFSTTVYPRAGAPVTPLNVARFVERSPTL